MGSAPQIPCFRWLKLPESPQESSQALAICIQIRCRRLIPLVMLSRLCQDQDGGVWWLEGRVRLRVFVLLCLTRWFVLPCTPKLLYVLRCAALH